MVNSINNTQLVLPTWWDLWLIIMSDDLALHLQSHVTPTLSLGFSDCDSLKLEVNLNLLFILWVTPTVETESCKLKFKLSILIYN